MSRRSAREALSKVGQRRQVVLPSSVCERLGLRIGDYVAFVVRGPEVLVQPRRLAPLSSSESSNRSDQNERVLASAPTRQERVRLLARMPKEGDDISLDLVRTARTVSPPPAPFHDEE